MKRYEVKFDTLLVLFRFFLNETGILSIENLRDTLNSEEYEQSGPNGDSYFHEFIRSLPKLRIEHSLLRQYDENIMRHLRHIGAKRGGIKLKYFQYISLLFTEIYLDRYFSDRNRFVKELNDWLHRIAATSAGAITFDDYTSGQLGKLAYMCATGSGKTLIMHINILQYLHYFRRARRSDSSLSLNHILLVTPNEGMSSQHLEELRLSDIPARIFSRDGIFSGGDNSGEVLIIDINKFSDRTGDKTVAVDSFESDNLVLVDEAHRGIATGETWVGYRRKISEDGFTFEYSATFRQSLNTNARRVDERAALEEYGKSIIMDYSYKYFYNDGYGKDYRIYNLNTSFGDENRQIYFVGCLLSFYQQVRFFNLNISEISRYNIEKPLLVFVGNKVVATTSDAELSDVQEVLAFIDSFVRDKRKSIQMIEDVLHHKTGLINKDGSDLFEHGLDVLTDGIYKGIIPDGADVYADILHCIFNTDTNAEEPRLHVENIRQIPGEIALKIGEHGDYFGVINIGSPAKLLKACAGNGIVSRNEEFHNTSLFKTINDRNSRINILIGSRKFTEGWNSWRVSTMCLINFAKSEGSQAIQLFGRGVRLKGLDNCLKRSSAVDSVHPQYIECVETLGVFGIKAQYMETFRQFLEEEDAPANENFHEINFPVINRYMEAESNRLRVIRVKKGIDFKKQSRRLILGAPDEKFLSYLISSPTQLDCQSKVQSILSDGIIRMPFITTPEYHKIPEKYLPLLDYQFIFDELILYKNEKGFYNINIIKEKLIDILRTDGWYSLIIPGNKLEINSFSGLETLNDFAVMALKSYIDKFFRYEKQKWEAPFLEYSELDANDNNFVDNYTIRYTPSYPEDDNAELIKNFVSKASAALSDTGSLGQYETDWKNQLQIFDFRNHLYAPLICIKATNLKIQVSPISLNDSEKAFVGKLNEYVNQNPAVLSGKSLFLLRNKSKTGIGFFEASNFYPDFILWIDTPEKQYITFIDPKGLLRIHPDNPKIRFFETIKKLEKRLQPTSNDKTIVLNSFIISSTPDAQLHEWWHIDRHDREAMNIYTLDNSQCVSSMIKKILMQ